MSEQQGSGTRARVAGKLAVAARTVWELDVMGQRFRCLGRASGAQASLFDLQVRTGKGWEPIDVAAGGANSAAELLRQVTRLQYVQELLAAAIENAQEM